MKWNKLFVFLPLLAILCTLSVVYGTRFISSKGEIASVQKSFEQASATENDSITIIGVGDIMPGTNFPSPKFLPPAENENLLLPATSLLQSATLSFGNLEGTILNSGGTMKTCKDPNVCYLFRIPE